MTLLPFDYSVRNLGRSPVRLALTVVACALVVGLVLAAASFVRGMGRSLVLAADHGNVLLVAAGSEESLERSRIPNATAGLVAASVPGIKTRGGVPYVSPEVNVAVIVRTAEESTLELRALLRGFTPEAFLVHPRVQIVDGRMPLAGRNEIMVGGLAGEMMGMGSQGLKTGSTIRIDNRSWTVTGNFRAPGTVMDAEVWMPLTDLQTAARKDGLSCVVLTLGDAEFDDIDAFARQRLDLGLTAMSETDYYGSIMNFYKPVQAMVWGTAFLVALAGILGGLNVMYAGFASRVREVGVLQALGYSRFAIVVGLVQESVLAASAGTLIGTMVALMLIDGSAVRFSMGVFELTVDGHALFTGLAAGLMMGVIGALPPAWRCLRLPIPVALRAS